MKTGGLKLKWVNFCLCLGASFSLPWIGRSADFRIQSASRTGTLVWSNAIVPGVCTIELASKLTGPWQPVRNLFATNPSDQTSVALASGLAFYRLISVDISGSPQGFANLCASYSILHTIAGKGDFSADGFNGWDPQYEGGLATDAELSRPHMAMADDAGNIYIADKDGHAIRKVSLNGRISTVAGMNGPGDDGDAPGPAIERHLSSPNGLWVRGDGTFYIVDLDSSKIRKVDTNGVMTTLFGVSGGLGDGRGLWVSNDEALAYAAVGTAIKKWTPSSGVKTFESGFESLGNLVVDPDGKVVATDRGANRVYRVSNDGKKSVIAGNGGKTGGGDGALAKETALYGVRGVWFLPNGGYFLATHEGSQIWYVDTSGIIHLFVDGERNAHNGDGDYFRTPGPKVSEVRAITMDKNGNLIITENDAGYIRKLDFLRLNP